MNRFLQMIMLFGLLEGADSGVTGAAAVIDTPPAVETTPVATETPAVGTETVVDAPAIDPNDPMAALNAAMEAVLPKDEPAEKPAEGDPAAIPEQFQQALQISEFVKSPESMQQAVRAADEVWKVATGQVPARQMLEGFKTANPQQYQAIVQDLSEYLGIQAQSQAQPSPLDGLKQANPDAYAEIAKYFEQVTGKSLDGPADPRDARLSAIEQRYAKEEQARQAEQWTQQVKAADDKAYEFLGSKLKGTFGEGQEQHFIGLIASKLGPEGIRQSMQEVLKGNTKSLETAYKAVVKEETARIKAYNANLIKQHRALANAVPASGAVAAKGDPKSLLPLPGESPAQQTKRLMDNGLL